MSILDETLIPFSDAPKVVEKRGGRRLSKFTLFRWRRVGIAGVRLEVQYIGNQCFTSLEALDRFYEAVTAAKRHGVQTKPPSAKQVRAANERAKSKLRKGLAQRIDKKTDRTT